MLSLALFAALSVLTPSVLSHVHYDSRSSSRSLHARSYVTDQTLAASYDFVIVGGGLAGLVLAARLTENDKISVLVLEAGDSGDAVRDRISKLVPRFYRLLS